MNSDEKIVILGAGPAGLGASYQLIKEGYSPIIFEKNSHSGGLCHSFEIDGFVFDTFVHFSFTTDDAIMKIFHDSTPYFSHPPESQNYWHSFWTRHPLQNNLYSLPVEERVSILSDLVERTILPEPQTYREWLTSQFGNYFTNNFSEIYTKKYWCTSTNDLEVNWVGKRISQPSLPEVLRGALEANTQNAYYTSEMRYPQKGGFQSFLSSMNSVANIHFNKTITHIDTGKKKLLFSDNSSQKYDHIISTVPLPEIASSLSTEANKAIDKLSWTSGAIVSIGLQGEDIFPFSETKNKTLWFYVYDEGLPFARVYYPSRKSHYNVPENCSSLQAEIYFHSSQGFDHNLNKLKKDTIRSLININVIKEENIVVSDIRYNKYANIIFDHNIYKNREIIQQELEKKEIFTAGRFGKWDYLWSDQSVTSGRNAANNLLKK